MVRKNQQYLSQFGTLPDIESPPPKREQVSKLASFMTKPEEYISQLAYQESESQMNDSIYGMKNASVRQKMSILKHKERSSLSPQLIRPKQQHLNQVNLAISQHKDIVLNNNQTAVHNSLASKLDIPVIPSIKVGKYSHIKPKIDNKREEIKVEENPMYYEETPIVPVSSQPLI